MTRCAYVCVDDGDPHETLPARKLRSTLRTDQTPVGRRSFCSWHDAGWRSMVIRELTARREVAETEIPAIDDQLIVLVVSGGRKFFSRRGRHWHSAEFVPGRLAMTAPGHAGTVRWQTSSPVEQRALQVYLPGVLMVGTAAQLWGRDSTLMPDALSTEDVVVDAVLRDVVAAARDGADDLYAETAAAFLAVRLISRHGGLGPPRLSGREDRRVGRAIDFMHENLHARIAVAEIADAVSLSTYHFIRVFRNATGDPPHRYLVRLRVARARTLLTDTHLGFGEVAARCGFTGVAQMRAAFHREIGASPGVVRAGEVG